MCLFSFTYWDKHYDQKFDDQGEQYAIPRDEDWYKFKLFIDVNERRIDRFNSTVIFDSENNPIECTCVTLSDGCTYFAVNKVDTFEKNYRENYLTLFKPMITEAEG
jgi:hypothetical protein